MNEANPPEPTGWYRVYSRDRSEFMWARLPTGALPTTPDERLEFVAGAIARGLLTRAQGRRLLTT